jgi:homoserine kinase type II
LRAIHGLQTHVAAHGCNIAPVPRPTRHGDTVLLQDEHLWELTPWMPGQADLLGAATPGQRTAALRALAKFHLAAASYVASGARPRAAKSPGLARRFQLLRDLRHGELDRLRTAARAAQASELREIALELVAGIEGVLAGVARRLEPLVDVDLPLQWCLRDVRPDHLLFTGEQVTGLLDFGAADVDSVGTDIARLLGGLRSDPATNWQAELQAYVAIRQLSRQEFQALTGFDEGGVLAAAANWIRWLFAEGRTFPHTQAVRRQLIWLHTRLQALPAE